MGKKKSDVIQNKDINFYTRVFFLEIYHDWDNYEEIINYIKSHYILYLMITHDKDIWTEEDLAKHPEYFAENNIQVGDLKKIHDHVLVKFPNPRYRNTIANELIIDSRWIQKVIKYKKAVQYLIHLNDPDKHFYSIDEVKGTLMLDLRKYLKQDEYEENKSEEIIHYILSQNHNTLLSVLKWVNKNGLYSTYRMGYSLYKDIIIEHNAGVY